MSNSFFALKSSIIINIKVKVVPAKPFVLAPHFSFPTSINVFVLECLKIKAVGFSETAAVNSSFFIAESNPSTVERLCPPCETPITRVFLLKTFSALANCVGYIQKTFFPNISSKKTLAESPA